MGAGATNYRKGMDLGSYRRGTLRAQDPRGSVKYTPKKEIQIEMILIYIEE
jgi:hypothetical protein